MSTRNRFRALAALALLASAAPLSAQTIRGTVVDAATEAPVAGATVTVLEGERRAGRAVTSADGAFVLELRRPGVVRVRAERLGYAPVLSEAVDVERREVVEMRLPLSVEAVALQAVTVTARRPPRRDARLDNVGFYERERLGFGRFLRREDIERIPSSDVAQVLDRLPGTTLIRLPNGYAIVFDRTAGVGMLTARSNARCFPTLYLDGVQVAYTGYGIDGVIPVERVEAIETYYGPSQTPPQWGGTGAACGVIVMWTRVQP